VESVRAMRNIPLTGEAVTVSAADPLNLVGILVPGERVPAISGRSVTYRDGVAQDAVAHSHEQSNPALESSAQQEAAAG
jgi:ATP-dependent Lhr-like helicase